MRSDLLHPPPPTMPRPVEDLGSEQVQAMAERGEDPAVFANPVLLRKSITAPLSAMLLAVVFLGRLAYMVQDLRPLSLLLVAACALVQVWVVVMAIPDITALLRTGPFLYLGTPGLWLRTVGWIDREEIERVFVFRVGDQAEIRIVPKDRAIVRRFPLPARISAATSSWIGGIVSIPWKGLSVSGPDLLAYMQTRYGLGTVDKALDPKDLSSALPGGQG